MNKIFFTPGPTELHPEVRKYISNALDENVCSVNHRSNEFMDIYKETVSSLKLLMNIPDDFNVFFLSSATECMDRIIQNCVESRSLHFVNGAFADRFYKTAAELNKDAEKIEAEYGTGFDFQKLKIQNVPELICITQNETSTGVAIDTESIYKFKKNFPEALLALDIVTSAPYVNLDFTKTDCAFFSVQKGFGLPAGLGVLIVNENCMSKAGYLKSKGLSGSYHNFISLYENAVKYQTTETPNVLGIYLLGKISAHLNNYGIDKIREETETKAKILYDFFDSCKSIKPFVKKINDRSKTIITVDAGENQKKIKNMLSENGIIAGSGYGKFKDNQIRIANFPMHKVEDVMRITEILKEVI